MALSSFGRHCKLFGRDFLARGGVPGYAFCNGLIFFGRWASPLFWQFEKFGAGKVFLLFADVAFGTVEDLLVYGMDARYRRGAPGVRGAFRGIRCKKQAFLVRPSVFSSPPLRETANTP